MPTHPPCPALPTFPPSSHMEVTIPTQGYTRKGIVIIHPLGCPRVPLINPFLGVGLATAAAAAAALGLEVSIHSGAVTAAAQRRNWPLMAPPSD